MGKTKTAVLAGSGNEELSGKAAYEAKKRAQEAKMAGQADKGQVKKVGLKGGERIKTIDAGPIVELAEDSGETKKITKKSRKENPRSQAYQTAKAKVDPTKRYPLAEAIKLVKETSYSKFTGSVELHLMLKKEAFSANVDLPFSAGKAKKIEVADESTLAKLAAGKVDFDVLVATAEMMPKLVQFAKLLGPRGLMPNPKNGTLVKSASEAKSFGGNSVIVKTEKKAPLTHNVVGKVDQLDSELAANIEAIVKAVTKQQIARASITSTMGPGVKVEIN